MLKANNLLHVRCAVSCKLQTNYSKCSNYFEPNQSSFKINIPPTLWGVYPATQHIDLLCISSTLAKWQSDLCQTSLYTLDCHICEHSQRTEQGASEWIFSIRFFSEIAEDAGCIIYLIATLKVSHRFLFRFVCSENQSHTHPFLTGCFSASHTLPSQASKWEERFTTRAQTTEKLHWGGPGHVN